MRTRGHLLAVGLILAVLSPASGAAGKTFEPTRKNDPLPGPCKPRDCSLREAIAAAGARQGRDVVVLKAGTYELDGETYGALGLTDGTLVRGAGMTRTTIDANEEARIFDVVGDGGRIRDLKLFDGRGNPGVPGDGGAILASGGETVVDSVLFDRNEASNGGAIFITQSAGVTIRNSVIQGSFAQHGGAIESVGQLRIERSTIVGNEAFSPGEGGAIDLRPSAAPTITRIISSSILTNFARAKGGAILADGNPYSGPDGPEEPQLFIVNSTIAFNRSQDDAGGIMADNGASVDIDNSSIGFNVANTDDTGTAVAGGVWQHSGANFNIDDSVIVGNSVGQGGSDPNCSGILSGAGNVLNTTATECQVSFTEPFNGYSTGTVALSPPRTADRP